MRLFSKLIESITSSRSIQCLLSLSLLSTGCHDIISSVSLIPSQFPDLFDLSIDNVITGLTQHEFTSLDLTRAYLKRISEINSVLHAVIELNPDALEIARSMDILHAQGISLGPMHGVPILIKDNIATRDQMNTTAGSYALLWSIVPEDATVIRRLRDAGAVILGKTNLSEFANWRSSNSSNGWSALGGQTFGPFVDLQDPSGSSSGSAVSMAVGLSTVSLGSETDGSIVSPANVNGVVGLKPTVGLVSRAGVIPISSHQDTVGPISKNEYRLLFPTLIDAAKTVRDAAWVLQIIAGRDEKDNGTVAIPSLSTLGTPDYIDACTSLALSSAKIGVPRQLFSRAPEYVHTLLSEAISVLRHLDAHVVDVAIPSFREFENQTSEDIVLQVGFKHDLKTYLSSLDKTRIHSLQDLISFTQSEPQEHYPSRDIARFEASEAQTIKYGSIQHAHAIQAGIRIGGTEGILAALDSIHGHVLMVPTEYASTIAAISGYPIISVPMGYMPETVPIKYNDRNSTVVQSPGIPVGVSFIARRFQESEMIRVAYAFEQATMARTQRRPKFKPSTQLKDVQGFWKRFAPRMYREL